MNCISFQYQSGQLSGLEVIDRHLKKKVNKNQKVKHKHVTENSRQNQIRGEK